MSTFSPSTFILGNFGETEPVPTYGAEDFAKHGNSFFSLKTSCHPHAGFHVDYEQTSEHLLLSCGWCGRNIALVPAARRTDVPGGGQ